MFFSTNLIVIILLLIIFSILYKGLPSLSWQMISQTPKGGFYFGKEGGILNAIIGSLYLSVGSTLLATAIGLPVALFMNVILVKHKKFVDTIRFFLDLLWGIPSIVYGAFGFTLMLALGLRASLLGGIITLAFLELPIMTRAMDEVIRMMPHEMEQAAFAVGATRLETATRVVTRQMLPGILTAVLLAFGRGIGDAASVLFTAGYTDRIPTSLMRPVASLPLAVFFQLGTPFPEVQKRAYASALILTMIVLAISLGSRWIASRLSRYTIR